MDDSLALNLQDFEALIAGLVSSAGLPDGGAAGALGLVFESDPHTVRVVPHPGQFDSLLVEVEVVELASWEPEPDAILRSLNHAARLAHGWIATVGEDRRVLLHTTRLVAGTPVFALEALLVDGIDRAQALATMLRETPPPFGDQPHEESGNPPLVAPGHFIRG